jgi:hypothetical protein
MLEAFHQFTHDMIGIGTAAAISAHQNFASLFKAIDEATGCQPDFLFHRQKLWVPTGQIFYNLYVFHSHSG